MPSTESLAASELNAVGGDMSIQDERDPAIRCAIVGAGNVVEDVHISALRGIPGVDIAAVCEPDQERARRFQERTGVSKVYASLGEMLERESDLDFVDIATPAHTHVALARQALDAGLHVLVEKPLAMTADEGHELDAFARLQGRKLCVLQTYRFRTPMLAATDSLKSGALGDLTKLSIAVRLGYDPFIERRGWNWAEMGSRLLLYELAVHYVDLAVFYAGPLRAILGFHATTDPASGAVTAVDALIEHESGVVSDLDLAVSTSSRFIRIDLFGSRQDASIKLFPEAFALRSGSVHPLKEVKTELRRTADFVAQTVIERIRPGTKRRALPHARIMAPFVAALRQPDVDVPVTATSAVPTLAALDSLHARILAQRSETPAAVRLSRVG
jgi:predicted dehydrogenase